MAIGNATMNTVDKILRTKYAPKLRTMTYPHCAFWGTVKKDENFGGNNLRISLRYGRPQGGSMLFSEAQANMTSSNDGAFLLTRARDYHSCGIDAEALLAGEGSENTIVNSIDAEMEGSTYSFARSIALQLYGNGGGARGRVGSISTNQLTLTEPNDVVFFEVDMFVQGSANDGSAAGHTLLNAGAKERIAAVDRDSGILRSVNATWTTSIAALAATNYLFRSGDFKIAAKGLRAWIPDTAPTSGDNFFGQDRSVDTTRLAGIRYTATPGEAKMDSLLNAEARIGREGGKPDAIYVNNADRVDIIRAMGSKVVYDTIGANGTAVGAVGFKVAMLEGSTGPIKIFADPNCPRGRFFMLQHDTWSVRSMKGVPHFADEDGQKMLRQTTNDGFEWRLRALWQLACDGPGYNCNGVFG